MKHIVDAVVVTAMQNTSKAINLYLFGGMIGLLTGIAASLFVAAARPIDHELSL